MRVVLDTNVFVSGVFFTGPPARILEAWRDGRITVALSPAILEEYRRVGLVLAARYEGVDLEPLLTLLAVHSEVVEPQELDGQVCDDPDDDKFLACALAAGAPVVVSGDKHLRRVSGWGGIEVLSPRQFTGRHLASGGQSGGQLARRAGAAGIAARKQNPRAHSSRARRYAHFGRGRYFSGTLEEPCRRRLSQ